LREYEDYIALSRYARFLPSEGRRETWEETVSRWAEFWEDYICDNILDETLVDDLMRELSDAQKLVLNKEVMPSMRSMMTAGKALERDNVAGYNCAYLPVDHPRAFDEAMYILMCGTGVGFSVEDQFIINLPSVPESFDETSTVIRVADSKVGWAKAYRELLCLLWAGQIPDWDVSAVRPAGEPLKTFGGRASGPEPLVDLFEFTVEKFKTASGRYLDSVECHDLMCKIGEIVVVGGVRRSAMISLSGLGDREMRTAKAGEWWHNNPQRALANNSAVYAKRPDVAAFMDEWRGLILSGSGERGIFNRAACNKVMPERREKGHLWGTNPCSEIILRPNQFCNLSEVVVRPRDTFDDLMAKVSTAAFIGTLQALLTDFRYLRKVWRTNCEEERLLGVSLTGILDNPLFLRGDVLEAAKGAAVATNKYWAERLGINQAAAVTCVKPSGTVSQLVNSASGMHPRHSKYYIRRVRADLKDPLTQLMIDQGVPGGPCEMNPGQVYVFEFPMKSPEECFVRDDIVAVEHLDMWRKLQEYWCEHKPSVTISVKDDEWLQVGSWVYENFDIMSGVSFLPHYAGTHPQMPYEEIEEEEFIRLEGEFPPINFEDLGRYEKVDNTTASQELACVGNQCDIV